MDTRAESTGTEQSGAIAKARVNNPGSVPKRPLSRATLIVSLSALVAGAAIFAVAWQATLKKRPTGARTLSWFYADGTPTRRHSSCGDIRFSTLVDGEVLWTPCDSTGAAGEGYGLARIDPARGRAVLLPFEKPSTFAGQSLGAAASPDGVLCWAFAHKEIGGETAVAVAGPSGWIHEPQIVPNGERYSRVLAMDWTTGQCELVVGRENPIVVTVTDAGMTSRPLSPRWSELCNEDEGKYCGWPAGAFRSVDGQWNVVFRAPLAAENPEFRALVLREDGVVRADVRALDDLVDYRTEREVDHSRLGSLVDSYPVTRLVTRDGQVIPAAAAHGDPWLSSSFIARRGGGLERIRSWTNNDRMTIEIKGANLEIWETDDALWQLVERRTNGESSRATIARTPSFECSLYSPAIMPRQDGGYWLVSQQGCYVSLDQKLERTDPLPLLEHLRSRGSRGSSEWNERQHERYLGWSLFGFLPCLLLSWFARRRTHRVLSAIMPGAVVFAVTGGFALQRVLWLLS